MTEELKQEAKEYIKNNYVLYSISGNDIELISQAYVAGAEPREKRIEELEAQIKKMKNCFNCRKGDWNNRTECFKSNCVNRNKWELKE